MYISKLAPPRCRSPASMDPNQGRSNHLSTPLTSDKEHRTCRRGEVNLSVSPLGRLECTICAKLLCSFVPELTRFLRLLHKAVKARRSEDKQAEQR